MHRQSVCPKKKERKHGKQYGEVYRDTSSKCCTDDGIINLLLIKRF